MALALLVAPASCLHSLLPRRHLRANPLAPISLTEATGAAAAAPAAATAAAPAAAAPRQPATAYYLPLQAGDVLESTPFHRAACAAAVMALLGCATKACGAALATAASPLGLGLAALLGIEFADFGSGCYHFGCDNYGSTRTPVLGRQIEAFQGHHLKPWTITHRQTCNNLHMPCLAGLPPVLFFLLAVDDPYVLTWATVAMCGIIGCQVLMTIQ